MATYLAEDTDLSSVANAIRSITGISGSLTFPSAFVSAINGINVITPEMMTSMKNQKHVYEDITTQEAFEQAIMLNDLPTEKNEEFSSSTYLIFVTKPTGTTRKYVYSYTIYFSSKSITIANADNFFIYSLSSSIHGAGFYKDENGDFYLSGTWKGINTTLTSTTASITGHIYYKYYQKVSANYWQKDTFTWARNISNTTIKLSGSGTVPSFNSAETDTYWKAVPFQNIIFDSNITDMGSYAFAYCDNLKSVSLSTCSTIYQGAFLGCSSLTSISFPNCTTIESEAFTSCAITTASFSQCLTISAQCFENCSSLTTIYFPVCTKIDSLAFGSCKKLTAASFPECSYIGPSAFRYCSSLANLSFPKCTSIGESAFYGVQGLTTVNFPLCEYIGSGAFIYHHSTTTISFPVCISIGNSAFQENGSLTIADFPECLSVGASAFQWCYSLTTANFPKCTYVGAAAFAGCSSLTTINFASCTKVNWSTFASCTNLTTADFPVCSYIDTSGFCNCSELQTISFPLCSIINTYAFVSCKKLASASFPMCSSIGNYAFSNCRSLSALYLMSTSAVSLTGTSVFHNTPMSLSTLIGTFGSIYVPASLLDTYKTKAYWSVYSNRLVGV